jgi:hypothetical protein
VGPPQPHDTPGAIKPGVFALWASSPFFLVGQPLEDGAELALQGGVDLAALGFRDDSNAVDKTANGLGASYLSSGWLTASDRRSTLRR